MDAAEKARIKWINDQDVKLSFSMTTAERIVLLGRAYDVAFTEGVNHEMRAEIERLKAQLAQAPILKRQAL